MVCLRLLETGSGEELVYLIPGHDFLKLENFSPIDNPTVVLNNSIEEASLSAADGHYMNPVMPGRFARRPARGLLLSLLL